MATKIRKIRDWVANRLDKNPDYCWASLAIWSVGFCDNWKAWLWPWHAGNELKRKDCSGESSYCGKCATTSTKSRQS